MKTNLLTLLLFGFAIAGPLNSSAQRRPLLFANPESPGSHPLADVRKQMLARFDVDQNGFLDKSEREAIRMDTQKQAVKRSDAVLKRRREDKQKGEEKNRPPQRWLKLYDENKNGRFDDGEWDKARQAEVDRVASKYDKDKSGALDQGEKNIIIKNLKRNSYHGYDAYIRRIVSGLEGENRGERKRSESRKGQRPPGKAFDTDGDGKASRDELKAIRDYEAKLSRGEAHEQ
jgi:Ca2+-binding EF-hand superfamily protein